MNEEFLKQALLQLIRWVAAPAIAWLAQASGVTEDTASAVLVGAAAGGIMFLWGLANKWRAEKKVEVALELPAGSSKETLKDVLIKK